MPQIKIKYIRKVFYGCKDVLVADDKVSKMTTVNIYIEVKILWWHKSANMDRLVWIFLRYFKRILIYVKQYFLSMDIFRFCISTSYAVNMYT